MSNVFSDFEFSGGRCKYTGQSLVHLSFLSLNFSFVLVPFPHLNCLPLVIRFLFVLQFQFVKLILYLLFG